MSRSYRLLGLFLVVMAVLVGLTQLMGKNDSGGASVSGDAAATVSTAADGVLMAPMSQPATTLGVPAPTVTAAVAADCTITETLKLGSSGDAVACLENRLVSSGLMTAADTVFDEQTDAAVRSFQTAQSLEVDGIFGRKSAQVMGIWAGWVPGQPASDADCPSTSRGAIVDRLNQRGALCENGRISYSFPITTARAQPDPGTYPVYAKDMNASSNFGGHYSTMTHFVAFTKGKFTGARVAFHSVPKLTNGEWVQPLDSVGTQQYFGESSGCIRVLPDDAQRIWDWLGKGDEVRVIS
jgi:peptidoglycan hydrolase-like protein with peptidoglycan-binding domain